MSTKFYPILLSFTSSGTKYYHIPPGCTLKGRGSNDVDDGTATTR